MFSPLLTLSHYNFVSTWMVSKWNADTTRGDEGNYTRYHNYLRGSCDNPHTCIPHPPVQEWPLPVWSHGHQWHASDGPAPLDGYGLAEVGIRLNRIDHIHGTEVTNLCNILTDCDRGYTSCLLLVILTLSTGELSWIQIWWWIHEPLQLTSQYPKWGFQLHVRVKRARFTTLIGGQSSRL